MMVLDTTKHAFKTNEAVLDKCSFRQVAPPQVLPRHQGPPIPDLGLQRAHPRAEYLPHQLGAVLGGRPEVCPLRAPPGRGRQRRWPRLSPEQEPGRRGLGAAREAEDVVAETRGPETGKRKRVTRKAD